MSVWSKLYYHVRIAALQAQGGRTSSDTEILQLQPDIANRIMHFMEFKEGRWYNTGVNTQKARQKFQVSLRVYKNHCLPLISLIDILLSIIGDWLSKSWWSFMVPISVLHRRLSLPKVLNLLIKFEAFTKLDHCRLPTFVSHSQTTLQ